MSEFKFAKQPKYGLAFDSETTGAIWGDMKRTVSEYQPISWGFVIFEMETFKPVDYLYLEIKYDPKFKWSEQAEKVHGLTIDYLEKNGITEEEAVGEIGNFLLKYFAPTEDIFPLGHNVNFDIKFLNAMMTRHQIPIKIGHRVFDTVAGGFMTFGVYNSNELFYLCGMEERKDHNALEDAIMTLDAARNIKEIFNLGLEQLAKQ